MTQDSETPHAMITPEKISSEQIFLTVCRQHSRYSDLIEQASQISDEYLLVAFGMLQVLLDVEIPERRMVALLDALRREYTEGDIYRCFRDMPYDPEIGRRLDFSRQRIRLDHFTEWLELNPNPEAKLHRDVDGMISSIVLPPARDHEFLIPEARQLIQGSPDPDPIHLIPERI